MQVEQYQNKQFGQLSYIVSEGAFRFEQERPYLQTIFNILVLLSEMQRILIFVQAIVWFRVQFGKNMHE